MVSPFIQNTTGPATIYQCTVTKVRPGKMAVDIYIPETGSKFKAVRLLSQNIGTTYGTIVLPEENSLGLVAIYHKSHFPVFLGCIPGYGFNSGEQSFELLKQGEQQMTAIGGGFFKLDRAGNAILGSKASAHQWMMGDGTFVEAANHFLEFSNLHRNSLRIADNNDIISLNRSFEYRQCAEVKHYSEDEILNGDTVDWDLETKILDEAYQVMQRLDGEDDIFSRTSSIVTSLVTEHTCTEADIAEYESFLESAALKADGATVRGEIFGDSALKVEVLNKDGDAVAGIEIDGEFGGKLTGQWVK